ncbi:hypothetical protein ACHAXA_008398 [Cyclostephanos tholiformis]|uniref:Uncharacterized protein n=1 Tax=Cyclostephanos tholiformis TaxID=382380 RepID=A0ABD3RVU5_9STRA
MLRPISTNATRQKNIPPECPTSDFVGRISSSRESPRNDVTMTNMKRVTFSESSHMYIVTNLRHGDAVHRRRLWYTPDEILTMKANVKFSILQTRRDISRKCYNRDGLFGIEKYLSKDLDREYKRRKRDLFLAVRAEQGRLRVSDPTRRRIPDIDRLAIVSLRHSRWAVDRALAAAYLLELDLSSSSSLRDNDELRIARA